MVLELIDLGHLPNYTCMNCLCVPNKLTKASFLSSKPTKEKNKHGKLFGATTN